MLRLLFLGLFAFPFFELAPPFRALEKRSHRGEQRPGKALDLVPGNSGAVVLLFSHVSGTPLPSDLSILSLLPVMLFLALLADDPKLFHHLRRYGVHKPLKLPQIALQLIDFQPLVDTDFTVCLRPFH